MFRWLETAGFSHFGEEGVSCLFQEENSFHFSSLFLLKEQMLNAGGEEALKII